MTDKNIEPAEPQGQARYPGYAYSGSMHDDQDGELDLRRWLLFFRRRKGIILSCVVFGTAIAGLYAFNKQPTYTAETLLKIEDDQQIVNLGAQATAALTHRDAIETEVSFITSRVMVAGLVNKLFRNEMAQAYEDPALAIPPEEPGTVERAFTALATYVPNSWLVTVGIAAEDTSEDSGVGSANDNLTVLSSPNDQTVTVDTDAGVQRDDSDGAPNLLGDAIDFVKGWSPGNWVVESEIVDDAVIPTPDQAVEIVRERWIGTIRGGLNVNRVGTAYVISVKYTDINPVRAARISRELAKLYIADQLEQKQNVTGRATTFLEERLVELEEELRRAELAVQEFIDENESIDPTVTTVGGQQMIQLTNMIVDARATRKEREARLRFIRDLQGQEQSLESLSEVLQSPYIANLWQQETDLQRQKVDLSTVYAAKHPVMKNIDVELEEIRDRVGVEIARVIENLESELNVIREREVSIQADMDRLMGETSSAGRSEVELRRLEREAEASRNIYENFLQRFKETREQQALVEANARIIAEASVPSTPSSRSPNQLLAMGFALSSLLGIGFAFVREKLDNGVRSGKEIEAELGIPFLGLVPYLSSSKRRGKPIHQYLLNKPLSTYTETVRSVYTALRLSDIDTPPKTIQVTSAVPQEGKTTLSVSLAVALALDGNRVCLIDGDMRHPSVKRELGFKGDGCLVSYLTGDNSLEESTHTKMDGKLDVIPIRRLPPNPAPLISSNKMKRLMAELRDKYDFVIMDGPPILGVSDSKALMELADTVLYVARWEKTTMDTASDAIKELYNCNANVVGCVMTQVDITKHAQYGYGGIDGYYKKYRKYYVD